MLDVKHPKHSKFAVTDMRERPTDFFFIVYDTGVNINSRNNFATLRSFANTCVCNQSIIPCLLHE